MGESNEHSTIGILSIILGLIGLISYFIGLFFYSFLDNRLYGMVCGIILGIISIFLGYVAKKQGDSYGTYGIYLGTLILIITVIIVLFTTVTTVEVGY